MEIRHNDIEINQEEPFANCKLGRKKHAEILTKIVSTYSNGFVLAINNEWGTGKTTFVKMWKQHLKNEGFQTLYFNAWENDFDTNPLVPLISEIKTLIKTNDKKSYKELLKKGAVLTKNLIPALVKAFAEKHIDSKTIVEFIENSAKAATDIFESEINQYASKKQGLLEFRLELEKFIQNNNNNKPVIYFIDELDRCRPNYSVEVLEQLKHFFSVKGIVFILSIDKEQLGNAVKGLYGSEKINSEEYLRRFIDLEYRIPEPSAKEISTYLFNYFQYDVFFNASERTIHNAFRYDKSNFIEFAAILFEKKKITIRQQEKLFSHTRLVLRLFKHNFYVFPQLLFLLVYLRDVDITLYKKIRLRQLSLQQLANAIETHYLNESTESEFRSFQYIESILILLYFNFYREIDYRIKLTNKAADEEKETLNFHTSLNPEGLLDNIIAFRRENFDGVQLDYMLSKIDLLEDIIN